MFAFMVSIITEDIFKHLLHAVLLVYITDSSSWNFNDEDTQAK